MKKSRVLDISLLMILTLIVHRGWLMPGILEYGDLWSAPREAMLRFLSPPYIWQAQCLGRYSVLTLWIYPITWLLGLIAHLGFDFGVAERVVWFFPHLLLSIFSMYYFTHILFRRRIVSFFSSLLYALNTYILHITAGGILSIGMTYALAPLILAFFIKGLKENRLRNSIFCGFLLALSISYEPRGAYLTIGALFIFFIWYVGEELLVKRLKSLRNIMISFIYLIIALTIPVILHFYWLLPSLLVQVPSLPSGYELAGGATALSHMRLNHAATLYVPFWPLGTLEFQQVRPLFFLIPLLVGLAIVLRPKDKRVILLTILAILSVFLVKGSNPPFGGVYIWLFKHFPGFNMFRDPGKFYSLVSLAYAPLLGVTIDSLASVFKREAGRVKKFRPSLFRIIFLLSALCFLLYLVFPAMTGRLYGTFHAHRVSPEYQTIEKFIKSQPPHFRTLWRPLKGRYTFYSQQYPVFPSIDPGLSLRFFLSDMHNPGAFKGTRYIAKILGLLNIKYCILPQEKYAYEIFGKDLNKDFFLSTFQKQIGLKKIDIGENIDIFENEYYAPRFFATPHSALVIGSRQALFELASLDSMNFSNWVLFFADGLKEESRKVLNNTEAIVFYNRHMDDLVVNLVDKDYRVDLYKYAIRNDDPTKGKWRKIHPAPSDVYGTRYGEITQSSGPVIYAFNHAEIIVPVDITTGGTYETWFRRGTGPKNGKLTVKAGTPKNGKSSVMSTKDLKGIFTYYDDFDSHKWKKVTYSHKGFHEISMKGSHGIVLSSPVEGGISELVYRINPPEPLKSLWIEWDMLYLQWNRVGRIYVSPDAKQWIQVGRTLTEDMRPYRIDVSDRVSGWENCYIKYQFEANPGAGGEVLVKVGYRYETISVSDILEDEDSKSKEYKFEWINGNTVYLDEGKYFFSITNEDGVGILDQLIVIPQGTMDALRKEISKLLQTKQVVSIKEGEDISIYNEFFKVEERIPVTWKMINPTKYEVKLKTEKPTYLVFSETFNPYWILKLSHPVPSLSAYSMINSFFIPKPGEIEAILEFTPQKYVYRGLWISGMGLVFICGYLLYQGIGLIRRGIRSRRWK